MVLTGTTNTKWSAMLLLAFGILRTIISSLNAKKRSEFVFQKPRRNGDPISSSFLENKFKPLLCIRSS